MIADDVIERVRLAADVVQIIGEYVPLKRAGGDYRGPCPFHQGTKPNFSVSPKRGSYHCFVCHESGDVFTFVRKRLGLDWVAAVKLIGEQVGIEVIDQPTRAHVPDPNEKNWEVLATASEWFRTQLVDDAVGRDARVYLEGRELDHEVWTRFGIGFAPRDAQAMRRYLHGLGFDDTRLLEAGLLVQRDGDQEPRGRFINRIMFSIHDEMGHAVAFGGRAMGETTPKYLNSGESAVFQKRRTLYGLHLAKQAIRRAGRAIVVEGYLDVIRLAMSGLEEVVAPLGTALTEEQAALLTRYAGEVFLLYDSDEAGQKATFRSGMELLRHKSAVRVVSLPEGEDPDTYVRAQGRVGMEAQINQAIDLFDRQIQLLERRGWFADLRHRRRAIDKLLPTIRAARDPLTRELYLSRLAEVSALDKALLASEADEPPQARRRSDVRTASGHENEPPPSDAPLVNDELPPTMPLPFVKRPWTGRRGKPAAPEWHATAVLPRPRRDEAVERAVVKAMLVERGLVERVAERHAPADFRDPNYRAIFAALLAAGHDDALDMIEASLAPPAAAVLRDLTESHDATTSELTDVTLSLARLDVRRLDLRIDEIRESLSSAPADEQDEMMRELMELQRESRRLLPVRSPRAKPKG